MWSRDRASRQKAKSITAELMRIRVVCSIRIMKKAFMKRAMQATPERKLLG
jgi:hypothetical protein